MKAVVLDAQDRFRLTEVEEPAPGPGEVAVRVAYAGVQWGDVLVRDGHFAVPRPFVPGFEAAGRVVAVGEGVDSARVGEEVLALTSSGAYAEVVVAPAALATAAGGLDLRTAAALGWTAPAAYDLVATAGRVRPGESVLVHAAAGGVGTLAVQFARLAGAARVVGVAGDADRTAYAKGFGYDEVLLRADLPELDEEFDVILDPVGGPVRQAGLDRLAPHGRLVAYGNLASYEPVTASANDLLMRGTSLVTYNGNLLAATHPERLAASVREAIRAVAESRVRVDVTAEYDLADVETAVHRLADGTSRGKTVVRVP
ncbi:zinc-binding dehydrogenase [Microbispora corallina]|uniref:NADPH:quinone reductase n=1 Tax=Microbispora corallina TaxID=83302 RepID=A0ABQ4G0K5_9ACTN|nr:zinc-binding dehydrogenase [Microbispora corallina]GIH40582.1 NADPH:quinone reductase [Microbispora corallina]